MLHMLTVSSFWNGTHNEHQQIAHIARNIALANQRNRIK